MMGDDPATSVVDAQGRSHDVPNLYVFDGSVWPTSAGMNPTATIAALALRFTDQLIESRARAARRGVRGAMMALSDEQRAQLGAIADELIPAGSGMPSASEAGVAGEFLDEVLAARPDLAAPLEARARGRSTGSRREPRSPRCATRRTAGACSPRSCRAPTS